MRKNLMTFLLPLAISVLILSGCGGGTGNTAGSTPASGASNPPAAKAADFKLPSIDGTTVSLADFAGKPIFLNLWDSN